ncbi:WD repeat-containing protein 27 [Fasciola gigantica]|uniref:WD repeat-containing protein 27 n=1 Tax=Fasciola gigantica TaxID=46835 RepID=A0A504YX31_FASGI|nr:WD repeat-containing protein 27 [Fasciola gigantica]
MNQFNSIIELHKPVWVFLESSGYSLIDIHDDMVVFCRSESQTAVYIGRYSLLPQVSVLQRYKHPIISVRFIASTVWIRVVIAHLNGIEIIQVDDITEVSVQNKKIILSSAFLVDNQIPCLFGVDSKTTTLVAALGSQLRIRPLTTAISEFVTLGSHGGQVKSMTFFERGSLLLVTCSDEACKIWNLELRHLVHTIQGAKISPGAFCCHPNEVSFIFGAQDGRIISVNMSKGDFDSYEICKLQECKLNHTTRSAVANHQQGFRSTGKFISMIFCLAPASDIQRPRWTRGYPLNPQTSNELSSCILSLTHVLVSDSFPVTVNLKEDLRLDSVLQRSPAPPDELHSQKESKTVKPKGLLNKPVTFGHPIKSSGYATQEPKRKMFQPVTSGSRHTRKTKGTTKLTHKFGQNYEKSEEAPSVLCRFGSVDSGGTPIYHVTYSLAWSADGRLVITGSADRTARLWALKTNSEENSPKIPPRTVLIMDSILGGASNGYGEQAGIRSGGLKSNSESSRFQPFSDSIVCAQFHYVDSFIYLVCRNMIRLYSYRVKYPKNVLDKGKVSSYYKLKGEFPIGTCNQLTAVSSVNIFYSYLVICAGSDRRLSVLDLNAGRVVLEIDDAHSRNITGIALNQGSVYSSPAQFEEHLAFEQEPTGSYNTYATVAPGDGVRMWDLRDGGNAVMQFVRPDAPYGNIASGQASNPLIPPVTAAFSPCGQQLIVGGRVTPNHPYPVIYDTRRAGSHPLATLTPKPDKRTVAPTTVVAWHPMRPEVTTGSHDGRLATYTTGLHLSDHIERN